MEKNIELPESWGLSPHQECVIGSLLDYAGDFVSSADLCEALYGKATTPAPAKLRVLMQRCREIIDELTEGQVEIAIRRNSGWKFTVRHGFILKKIIEKAR